MRAPRTLRVGLALAVIAIGVVCASCIPAPPGPTGPASLSVSPSPAAIFQNSVGVGVPPVFPMPEVTVTVTNTGGHTATNIVVHPVSVYSVPSSTCSTLAPGQSCTAIVQFCPTSVNSYDFALSVTGQDSTTGAPLTAGTMLMGNAT